jgi:hypothetical protein
VAGAVGSVSGNVVVKRAALMRSISVRACELIWTGAGAVFCDAGGEQAASSKNGAAANKTSFMERPLGCWCPQTKR